jgi:hypothetical protein
MGKTWHDRHSLYFRMRNSELLTLPPATRLLWRETYRNTKEYLFFRVSVKYNICQESTENVNNKSYYELCAPNVKISVLFAEVWLFTGYVDVKNYWILALRIYTGMFFFFFILYVIFFQMSLVYMTLIYK